MNDDPKRWEKVDQWTSDGLDMLKALVEAGGTGVEIVEDEARRLSGGEHPTPGSAYHGVALNLALATGAFLATLYQRSDKESVLGLIEATRTVNSDHFYLKGVEEQIELPDDEG